MTKCFLKKMQKRPNSICHISSIEPIANTERAPRRISGLGNGGYLLSHKCSTIGDAELNDPVRNGKGWDLSAITT